MNNETAFTGKDILKRYGGGGRERELETGNKNALQRLGSLSGEDPTLS